MEKKNSVYIFPLTTNKAKHNNYVPHFATALQSQFHVVNKDQKVNLGMLDLLKYARSNIFIFNWTENLSQLKAGGIQILVYLSTTALYKLLGKKIVWIFHNKAPHTGHTFSSRLIMKYNAMMANLVITHSHEGVAFYKSEYGKDNIAYMPHPIYPEAVPVAQEKIYDIIIWGSIEPYKNVLGFLKYWSATSFASHYHILVCGKCKDAIYGNEIRKLTSDKITFIDEYLSVEKLNEQISKAKTILFTYDNESILSSGALTYSLSFGNRIIGPSSGSFKDYEEIGLTNTFKTFDDIPALLSGSFPDRQRLDAYIQENGWNEFVEKLKILLGSRS